MSANIASRDHFATESVHPQTGDLDRLEALEAVRRICAVDAEVQEAIEAAAEEIAQAVERVATSLRSGGRLFYLGAGTSGRLGLLDAVECPPTFGTDPDLVQAILAGGEGALYRAVEGAEDDPNGAVADFEARGLKPEDVVFGIAAGGTTPFVHGALRAAKERGASTIFFACVPREQAADHAELSIRVVTGPEALAGSTRLKAGTATKRVLNMVTTLAMARLGKVHENLMVDVNTKSNAKLVERGVSLVARIAEVSREEARVLLKAADGHVKTACVMHAQGETPAAARRRLERCDDLLRRALEKD